MDELDDDLCEACCDGDAIRAEKLVNKGANIHCFSDEPFKNACTYGHLETVKYLLEVGIDISYFSDAGLIEAAKNGHIEIVNYLHQNGADINIAFKHAHKNIINILLSKVEQTLINEDVIKVVNNKILDVDAKKHHP